MSNQLDEIIVGGNKNQFPTIEKHPFFEFPIKQYLDAVIVKIEKQPIINPKEPTAAPKDGISFTYEFPGFRVAKGTGWEGEDETEPARITAYPIGLSMDKRATLFRMLQAICGEDRIKEYQKVNIMKLKGVPVKVQLKKKISGKGTQYFVVQDWDGTPQSKVLEIGING